MPAEQIDRPFGGTEPAPQTPSSTPPPFGPDRPFSQPDGPDPLASALQARQPDRAARLRELSQKTGVPVPLVERNFEALDAMDKREPFNVRSFRARAPEIAKWLERNPDYAAIVADDLPGLANTEESIRVLGAIAQGIDNTQALFGGGFEAIGQVLGWKALEDWGADVRTRNSREAEQYGRGISVWDVNSAHRFAKWATEAVLSNTPQLSISIGGAGAGAAIGSAFGGVGAVPGAVIGALIGSAPTWLMGVGEIQQAQKDIDPDAEAGLGTFVGGTAVAILDSKLPGKIGTKLVMAFGGKLAEKIAAKTLAAPVAEKWLVGTVREGWHGFKTEGITEALQKAITDVTAALNTGVDMDWRKTFLESVDEFAAGSVVGGTISAGTHATVGHRVNELQVRMADQSKRTMARVASELAASKTLQRDPATASELVQAAGDANGTSTIGLPIDTFEQYWQQEGITPALIAAELAGDPDALAKAKAAGLEDLQVPIGAYTTKIAGAANQKHARFFEDEMRVGAKALNVRESREMAAQLAKDLEAAVKHPEQAEQGESTPAKAIALDVLTKFTAAGIHEREAQAWALFIAVRNMERARALDIADPLAFYQQHPVNFMVSDVSGTPTNVRVGGTAGAVVDIPASVAPEGETLASRSQRETAHRSAVSQAVVNAAVRLDPHVDQERIRTELARRLTARQEAAAARIEGDVDPVALLKAVASYGLWYGKTGTRKAETLGLVDGLEADRKRLKDGVESYTVNGIPGVVRSDGLPLDELLQRLQQDGRFAHIRDEAHLEDLIDLASRPDTAGGTATDTALPGTQELARELGIDLDAKWWLGEFADVDESPTDEGDTSFNPDELEQRETFSVWVKDGERWKREDTPPFRTRAQAQEYLESTKGQDQVERRIVNPPGPSREELYQTEGTERGVFDRLIRRFLDPESAARRIKAAADALERKWLELPTIDDVAAVAKAGEVAKGWYTEAADALLTVFGPVDVVRFVHLMAALSPQNEVPTDLRNSLKVWLEWEKAERPESTDAILEILARSVQGQKGLESALEAWQNNVVRALSSHDPYGLTLSGAKVDAFWQNLLDELWPATLDTWMLTFAGLFGKQAEHFYGERTRAADRDELGDVRTGGPGYEAFSALLLATARQLTQETGKQWHVANVQETVWAWTYAIYNLAKRNGETATEVLASGRFSVDTIMESVPTVPGLLAAEGSVHAGLVREILALDRRRDSGKVFAALAEQLARIADGRNDVAAAARFRHYGDITQAEFDAAARIDTVRASRLEAQDETRKANRLAKERRAIRRQKGKDALRKKGELYQTEPYQQDLFGNPLRANTTDVMPGSQFLTKTRLVQVREQELGRATVNDATDVAAAMAYMNRSAVEHFEALVTDAGGRPLAIVGSFKGRVGQAQVFSDVLLFEALQVEGAAHIWPIHNHPSGNPTISNDDRGSAENIAEKFRDTGITPHGIIALAPTGFEHYDHSQGAVQAGIHTPAYTGRPVQVTAVPIAEREFVSRATMGPKVTSPQNGLARIGELAGDQMGLVLLNHALDPLAFVPVDYSQASQLRQDDTVARLMRSLSVSGASTAIIHVPGAPVDRALEAAENLANALHFVGLHTIDVVYDKTTTGNVVKKSLVIEKGAQNGLPPLTGDFFQTEDAPFYSRIERAIRESTQSKATGAQWKATLKNAGVNLDEFRALALDKLEDGRRYTREQVLEEAVKHRIEVKVTTLVEGRGYTDTELHDRAEQIWNARVNARVQEMQDDEGLRRPYRIEVQDITDPSDDEASWEVQVRDGYDDVVFEDIFDSEEQAEQAADEWRDKGDQLALGELRDVAVDLEPWGDAESQAEEDLNDEAATRIVQYNRPPLVETGAEPGTYREVFLHGVVPAHPKPPGFRELTEDENYTLTRFSELGALVKAVQAGQWAEVAEMAREELDELSSIQRQHGTVDTALMQVATKIQLKATYARQSTRPAVPLTWLEGERWSDGHDGYDFVKNPIVRVRYSIHKAEDGTTTLYLDEVQAPSTDEQVKMPAIFRDHWRELGMKWALHQAAVLRVHQVAWTSGDVQVKRYSLRQHVDEITYDPVLRELRAFKQGEEVAFHSEVRRWSLHRYISEELTERLLASREPAVQPALGLFQSAWGRFEYVIKRGHPGTNLEEDGEVVERFETLEGAQDALRDYRAEQQQQAAARVDPDIHRITGDQIEFGGEGIARVYDTDLPATARKIVKPAGAKTSVVQVPFGTVHRPVQPPPEFIGRTINTADPVDTLWFNERWSRWQEFRTGHRRHYHESRLPGGARRTREEAIEDLQALADPRSTAHPIVARAAEHVLEAMELRGQTFVQAMEQWGTRDLADQLGGEFGTEYLGANANQIETLEARPGLTMTPALQAHLLKGQSLFQDPPAGGPPRGIKGSYNREQRLIRLIAGKRDLSTFLHEASHMFLDELVEDALTVAEGHRLRLDATIALSRMGFAGTLEEWAALSVDDKRTTHEAWAEAFTDYLHSGLAPIPELQPLFQKFRAWLIEVYKTLKRTGREVPEDVRGVMDRLFASEAAIQSAGRQLQPLFATEKLLTDAAVGGVAPLTWAAYVEEMRKAGAEARQGVDARLMAEWRKTQNAEWTAKRQAVEKEVRAELMADAGITALAVLQSGKLPDGSVPPYGDGRPLRLSKTAILQQFGQAMVDRLATKRPYVYSVEGGLDPGVIAQATGFLTSEAMLEAVIAAPKLEAVVSEETNRRMLERHGERLLEGMSLADVAAAAVYDQRRKIVSAELNALTQGMARDQIPRSQVLRQQAQTAIARTRVRELRPDVYRAAAARASQAAFRAWSKNDRAAAIAEKQKELLALEYYRAASEAQQSTERIAKRMRQLDTSPTVRGKLGKGGVLEQVDAILDRYEFRTVTNKQLDRRENLRTYLEKLAKQGIPTDHIPDEVKDDARAVNWRELTVEELKGVSDGVEMIAHLGRFKDKLLARARQRDLLEVRNEIADAIEREGPAVVERSTETRLRRERRRRAVRGALLNQRTLASLLWEMDGYQYGPLWRYVMRPLNEALTEKASMLERTTKRFTEMLNEAYSGSEQLAFQKLRYIPELGPPTSARANLSHMGRLLVALNYGNPTNIQRTRDGLGWTEAQHRAVIDTLDERDWRFVVGVWQMIDEFWPDIAAKMVRIQGVAADKVEAVPFTNKFGQTLPGGYFPLMYNGQVNPTDAAHDEANTLELHKQTSYMNLSVRRNHEKPRSESDLTDKVIRQDLGVIVEHLNAVIHSLALHETVIDVGRILRADGEAAKAIIRVHGDQVYTTIQRALKFVAVGEQEEVQQIDRFVDHLRRGSQVVGLGLNFVTPLMQLAGAGTIMARVGPGPALRAFVKVYARGAFWRNLKTIQAESDYMRLRPQTMSRELNEVAQRVGLNQSEFDVWMDTVTRAGASVFGKKTTYADFQRGFFSMITIMQNLVDAVAYTAARDEALRAGHDLATAIEMGNQTVRDTQASGESAYQAEVMRGGAWKKLFTTFFGPMLAQYNLAVVATNKRNRDVRRGARLKPNAAWLAQAAFLFLVGPAWIALMREVTKGDLGDDDDLERLVTEILLGASGQVILLRDVGQAIASYRGYEGPPGMRPIATVGEAAQRIGRAWSKEDYAAVTKEGVRASVSLFGAAFHLPAGLANRAWRAIEASNKGELEVGLLRAVLFGYDPEGYDDE